MGSFISIQSILNGFFVQSVDVRKVFQFLILSTSRSIQVQPFPKFFLKTIFSPLYKLFLLYHKLLKISGLVCARNCFDNGDIPIGNEVQNLVFSSELCCSNANADDLARYSNRDHLSEQLHLLHPVDVQEGWKSHWWHQIESLWAPIPIATPAIPHQPAN